MSVGNNARPSPAAREAPRRWPPTRRWWRPPSVINNASTVARSPRHRSYGHRHAGGGGHTSVINNASTVARSPRHRSYGRRHAGASGHTSVINNASTVARSPRHRSNGHRHAGERGHTSVISTATREPVATGSGVVVDSRHSQPLTGAQRLPQHLPSRGARGVGIRRGQHRFGGALAVGQVHRRESRADARDRGRGRGQRRDAEARPARRPATGPPRPRRTRPPACSTAAPAAAVRATSDSTAGCHGSVRSARSEDIRSAAIVYWARSLVPMDRKSTCSSTLSASSAAAGHLDHHAGNEPALAHLRGEHSASAAVATIGAMTHGLRSASAAAATTASSWRSSSPGLPNAIRSTADAERRVRLRRDGSRRSAACPSRRPGCGARPSCPERRRAPPRRSRACSSTVGSVSRPRKHSSVRNRPTPSAGGLGRLARTRAVLHVGQHLDGVPVGRWRPARVPGRGAGRDLLEGRHGGRRGLGIGVDVRPRPPSRRRAPARPPGRRRAPSPRPRTGCRAGGR